MGLYLSLLITRSGLRKDAESPNASGSSIDKDYLVLISKEAYSMFTHPSVSLRRVVGYNRIPDTIASRTAGLCGITLILANRAVRTLSYRRGPGSASLLLSQVCSFTHRGMFLRLVPVSPGSHPQENTFSELPFRGGHRSSHQ